MEYDKKICLQSREKFLKLWLTKGAEIFSFVAKKKKKIVGFGVFRKFGDYFGLTPLYAENEKIAEILFWNLLKNSEGKISSFPILATNFFMQNLMKKIGIQIQGAEFRHVTENGIEYQKNLAMQKCYTFLDYWPI